MTVHPAKGITSGTLVNALLYHWGRPAIEVAGDGIEKERDDEDDEDEECVDKRVEDVEHEADSGGCTSTGVDNSAGTSASISRKRDLSLRPGGAFTRGALLKKKQQ